MGGLLDLSLESFPKASTLRGDARYVPVRSILITHGLRAAPLPCWTSSLLACERSRMRFNYKPDPSSA